MPLPTSEYDTAEVCRTCDRAVRHTFDHGTEEKLICGWYGEPDFACIQRLDIAQQVDVTEATSELCAVIDAKYVMGVMEHGGYGWEMGATRVLGNAYDEVADLAVYLKWARDAIETIRAVVRDCGDPAVREAILRIIDGDPGRR